MLMRLAQLGWLVIGVALACVLCSRPASALNVSGAICNNTVWAASDNPIVVTGSVSVGNAIVCGNVQPILDIGPGAEVRVGQNLGITVVQGTLRARGTVASPVTFTANVKVPPQLWNGIRFASGAATAQFDAGGSYTSGSIIEHAIV